MAMAMLGLQDASGVAAAAALALALARGSAYAAPEGAVLERARAAAARFKLSGELAAYLPPDPGRLASRKRKDLYRAALIALKRVDALDGDERAAALEELRLLLGTGGAAACSAGTAPAS